MRRGHLHSPVLRHTHTHRKTPLHTSNLCILRTQSAFSYHVHTQTCTSYGTHTHTHNSHSHPLHAPVWHDGHLQLPRISCSPPLPLLNWTWIIAPAWSAVFVGGGDQQAPAMSPTEPTARAGEPKSTSQRSQICTFFEVPPSRETENSSFTRGWNNVIWAII